MTRSTIFPEKIPFVQELKFHLDEISKYIGYHETIVDLGCGFGTAKHMLENHCVNYIGVDLFDYFSRHHKQGEYHIARSFDLSQYDTFVSIGGFHTIVSIYHLPLLYLFDRHDRLPSEGHRVTGKFSFLKVQNEL